MVHQTAQSVSRHARVRAGFSIVDLLVSLAVMSLLIAMLLPSLGRAREAGFRTASASNIRQQGIGLQMFAYDARGKLPTSVFASNNTRGVDAPEQMVFLRVDLGDAVAATGRGAPASNTTFSWDGLGRLFNREYLSTGEVFYNPSHDDVHVYDRYAPFFNGESGAIVCNYQYRWDAKTPTIDRVRHQTTLIADAMRSQPEYNHRTGNNMLKGDLSVSWFSDTGGTLFDSLAPEAPMVAETEYSDLVILSRSGVINAWELLDDTKQADTTAAASVNDPLNAFFNINFE
ncbi:MAG: type II secretion system protein [Planctomycetota bacterium]